MIQEAGEDPGYPGLFAALISGCNPAFYCFLFASVVLSTLSHFQAALCWGSWSAAQDGWKGQECRRSQR